MRSRAGLVAVCGAMLAAAVALPLGGTAYAADTAGATDAARTAAADTPSALVLTLSPGESAQTVGVERAVTLTCTPSPGGSHPAPQEACAELSAADGDLAALPAQPQSFCAMIYAPVVVTVQGAWQGERVDYARSFPNECVMRAQGGPLYAF
ncbi:subtilase-type protease inhibitor [Streptomyces sp. RB6PN25]|uniref:Subtilase-type protease inhibitor n=1 Tax=Streptomyces humicola TaxID=2953240 RepID=A0ABT1PS96_9ACTN|nr:subtilase-type protease inhibitor [Streptomyces humicola]MCQ4080547.1 subtilase-type protease inhibitor [Streptomyces humicola]